MSSQSYIALTPASSVVSSLPVCVGAHPHFVQFFDNDASLIDNVVAFIVEGLSSGEAGIVVATEPHRKSVESRVRRQGLPFDHLVKTRQLVLLDAAETLRSFMIHGLPDPVKFRKVIGEVLEEVQQTHPKVRAFGEMVSLLWSEGNIPATIRLEREWNELRGRFNFTLFCGYGLQQFESSRDIDSFKDICDQHSLTLPSQAVLKPKDQSEQLRLIAELQQKASTLEKEIEERTRVEETLARANDELRNFTYAMSHDLKEPLRTIRMHLQRIEMVLAKKHAEDEEIAPSIGFVVEAAQRMEELLTGTLSLARLEADTQPLQLIDMGEVLDEAIANLQETIENSGARVTRSELPKVRALRGRMVLVLQNLISNGIKFRNGHMPVVHVTANKDATTGEWVFSVADNGIGIPSEFHARIFSMFQRLHTSDRYPGAGLGLSICKKAIEGLKGKLWVESEPLKGACFKFSLPACDKVRK